MLVKIIIGIETQLLKPNAISITKERSFDLLCDKGRESFEVGSKGVLYKQKSDTDSPLITPCEPIESPNSVTQGVINGESTSDFCLDNPPKVSMLTLFLSMYNFLETRQCLLLFNKIR